MRYRLGRGLWRSSASPWPRQVVEPPARSDVDDAEHGRRGDERHDRGRPIMRGGNEIDRKRRGPGEKGDGERAGDGTQVHGHRNAEP